MKKKLLLLTALTFVMTGMAAGAVASVDEIDYTGNVEGFQDEVFVIDMVSTETTDNIQAFVDSNQLSEQVEDGETDQSVEVTIDRQSYYARYNTQLDNDMIDLKKPHLVRESGFATKQDAIEWGNQNCYNPDGGQGEGAIDAYASFGFDGDAVYDYAMMCMQTDDSRIWKPARLQSPPDQVFNTTICVEADGKPQECKAVSNSEIESGRTTQIGEHTQVLWEGSHSTGRSPSNPQDTIAIHHNSQGWKLASEDRYDSYVNYLDNVDERIALWRDGQLSKEQLQTELDNNYNDAISSYESSSINEAYATDSSFESGMFEMELDYATQFPSLLVYLDGVDYVEVEKTKGVPEIIDYSGTTVGEVGSGTITASVKNTGEREGSFTARISECGQGFTPSDTQKTQTLDSGEIHDFQFRVSFSSQDFDSSTIEDACTVEVQDTASLEKDTASVKVTGEQANSCEPGEPFVEAENRNGNTVDVIYVCDSDGQQWNEDSVCSTDEYADRTGSGYECVDEGEPPTGECGILDFSCGNNSTGLPFMDDPGQNLRIMMALIAGAIGFGLGFRQLGRFAMGEEYNEQTAAVLGLVLGGLAAFTVYSLWSNPFVWVGLIVVGVLVALYGNSIAALLGLVSGGD